MKRHILSAVVAVVACFSLGSNALAITIDFEEFSVGAGNGLYPTVLQSQGFEFSGLVTFNDSTEVLVGSLTGSNAYGGSIGGPGQDGFGVQTFVDIERSDGGVFAVYSWDLLLTADSSGFTQISGVLAGGGAANLGVPMGTGDWLNLESLRIRAEGNQFGFGFAEVELDNIVVTAVPIPAAVWLFASALAGLGWARRRRG